MLADHVSKSYSVGDVSASNAIDFVDGQQHLEESDDELDNRLLADQYNREVAEMTAANSDTYQQPTVYGRKTYLDITLFFAYCMLPYTHTHAILRPFSRYTWVSQCCQKRETYWNNHWIFMSPMSFRPLSI